MRRLLVGLIMAAAMLSATQAQAAPFTVGFDCITDNEDANCDILEAQFFATYSETVGGFAILIENTGWDDSNAEGAYLNDPFGIIDSISVLNGSNVAFSVGCAPPDLPGLNGFNTGGCADADPPPAHNGIGSGEWMTLFIALNSGFTFEDAMNVKVGIHVGSFEDGGSVSGVSRRPDDGGGTGSVPEPASLSLIGLALGGLAIHRRRK